MKRGNSLLVTATVIAVLGMATVIGILLANSMTGDSLPFDERWYFNTTLDRGVYHPGDNITLTVQLTCLIDYKLSEYRPDWFRLLSIDDSSNTTVWQPTQPPGITCFDYEFHAGDELGATNTFQLGTTEELPPGSTVDWNHWIPLLTAGDYHFTVRLGLLIPGVFPDPVFRVPFAIE
ncbi:MAG: hypothetical protein ACFFD4_34585 [Candidatus Odinarchaeota archaeon]